MDVLVTAIRLLNNGKPLKAFCDVQVGDWTVHEFRIIKHDGQRAWVSMPQTSWRGKEGKVKYRSLLSIPGEMKQRIELAILSAWERKLEDGEKT